MRQDQKCHGKSAELNDSHGLAWVSTISWCLYIFYFMESLWLLHSEFLYRSLIFSSESPSRRFRNRLSHQGNISYLLGYTMEGMTQTKKGPLDEKKSCSAQSEELSFQLYLLWAVGWHSECRSRWLHGQGYHKHGRTSGFGGQRRWVGSSISLSMKRFQELKTLLEIKLRAEGNSWSRWVDSRIREEHVEK